jgi:hypothetical protein
VPDAVLGDADIASPKAMLRGVRMKLRPYLATIVLIHLLPALAAAQSITGSITGVVTGGTGVVIPGAEASVINAGTSIRSTAPSRTD